jgi:hypothetical protein
MSTHVTVNCRSNGLKMWQSEAAEVVAAARRRAVISSKIGSNLLGY